MPSIKGYFYFKEQIYSYSVIFICRTVGSVIESTCQAKDTGLILGSGRSPGEGNGYPVFLPGKSKDKEDWQAAIHRVTKSWTRSGSWTCAYTDALIHMQKTFNNFRKAA